MAFQQQPLSSKKSTTGTGTPLDETGKLACVDGSEAHLPNVLQAHMAAPEIVNKCDAKETWLVHDGMQIKCMDAYFNSKNKCPLCPGYRKQMPEEDGMCVCVCVSESSPCWKKDGAVLYYDFLC